MNDCSLPIQRAAAGDQEAFAVIVQRMMPLIHDQIHRLNSDAIEAEDLAQEALIGLLAAVRTFRPDRGAAFTTYATTCIRNRLLDAIRRCGDQTSNEVPLEEDADLPDASADPALRVQEQEGIDGLLAQLKSRLTPMEYQVLLLRLSNRSYEEIAAKIGVSKKAVDNAVQRIRRKLSFRQ